MPRRGHIQPLLERWRRRPKGGVMSRRHRALKLAMRGQYSDAAALLLAHLPVPITDTGAQEAEHRRQASLAVAYLAMAGETETAERLGALLGEA